MKLYKIFILFILFNSFSFFGQIKKEKKILLFVKQEMSFDQNVFIIDGVTFKYHENKKYVKFNTIKNFVSNLNDMNSYILKSKAYDSRKNVSFYYSMFYDIYVYKEHKKNSGYLYPVERIWVVKGKIID
ncbi:hypothetical protein [Flavobacterium sp. T12S277]|uniref:hypothetical protein n=1 Tax=Flavobacterium sp. T12S277 TaxID=3402752 RepID=UPI003AE91835